MNNATLKLELLFIDRKRIVEDITKVISRHDLNIISMEVKNKDKKTLIYLETKSSKFSPSNEQIIESLKEIPSFIELSQINSMPQEIREERLKVVLDSISDGIISIDKHGYITTINRIAKTMLGLNDSDFVGKKISSLPGEHPAIVESLKGKFIPNIKRNIITQTGRYQLLSACIAIRDFSGQITGAIEIMRDIKEIAELADELTNPSQPSFNDIIGKSPAIMDAISFAQKIAPSSSIVSIRGDSGTGKELFARAIHAESNVKGDFIAINCAALPETLLESELFGYEKGTFTGAESKGKPGLFELANNGTLFLDEIAEMSAGSQAKILRVIQEKSIRRIGGAQEIPINTRILTATSQLIEQLIKTKKFREDLYYRINVLPIHVPPLKERISDINLLSEYFLSKAAKQIGRKPKKLTDNALQKLFAHNWPGNVRELKNVIERAAMISDSDFIDIDSIIFGYEIEKTIKGLTGKPESSIELKSLRTMLDKYEKIILDAALKKYPSIRKSAKAIDISHTTLLHKMKKHGITKERTQ